MSHLIASYDVEWALRSGVIRADVCLCRCNISCPTQCIADYLRDIFHCIKTRLQLLCAAMSSKLWSFLVTGTTGRHELKIWSTQTWSCLQTVTLLVPPTALSSPLPGSAVIGQDSYLQLGVDLSASYLVLCDIGRKVTFHVIVMFFINVMHELQS